VPKMSNESSEDVVRDPWTEWRCVVRQILIKEGIIDSKGNFLLHQLSKEEAEKRIKNALEKICLLPL